MINSTVTLFITFLKIGLFSIGGGYAIIPLIQEQVVTAYGWLTMQEYTDIISISQMTPGPLVVNTATFVGLRLSGILGAVVATIGSILPGFIVSVALYNFFTRYKNVDSVSNVLKGLRSGSVGLIASAAATILLMAFFGVTQANLSKLNANVVAICIFAAAFFLLRKYKFSPILIMVLTGIAGVFLYM